MKNRYLTLCILIALATLAATVYVYGQLPARVPVHWNASGAIDRYGSRGWVFLQAVFLLVFVGIWSVLPRVSPRHYSVDGFSQTFWLVGLLVVALLAFLQCVILWGTASGALDMSRVTGGGLSVFEIVLGNVFGKVRRNFWLGIRTPWTLANERVWYATHRLAAKWMVGTGLVGLVCVLAGVATMAATWLFVLGVLAPAVWSLFYYKRLERSGGLEA